MRHEKQNPAPLAGGNRAKETVIQLGQTKHRPNPSILQGASSRLERRIADMAAIADWRDDLQSRIRRAQLVFELVDIGVDTPSLSRRGSRVQASLPVPLW